MPRRDAAGPATRKPKSKQGRPATKRQKKPDRPASPAKGSRKSGASGSDAATPLLFTDAVAHALLRLKEDVPDLLPDPGWGAAYVLQAATQELFRRTLAEPTLAKVGIVAAMEHTMSKVISSLLHHRGQALPPQLSETALRETLMSLETKIFDAVREAVAELNSKTGPVTRQPHGFFRVTMVSNALAYAWAEGNEAFLRELFAASLKMLVKCSGASQGMAGDGSHSVDAVEEYVRRSQGIWDLRDGDRAIIDHGLFAQRVGWLMTSVLYNEPRDQHAPADAIDLDAFGREVEAYVKRADATAHGIAQIALATFALRDRPDETSRKHGAEDRIKAYLGRLKRTETLDVPVAAITSRQTFTALDVGLALAEPELLALYRDLKTSE